jgi:16S rRNA (cytosine967-C5)-methyltransferase
VALYQLMFLDRVPAYAALNEAVALAKTHAGGKAGGFVNGVLRNYLRDKERPAKPDPKKILPAALADYWSHPEWLVERWLKYFGAEETGALLEANNHEAPLVLRTNLQKTSREGLLSLFRAGEIEASPARWAPQCIHVFSRRPIDQLPGFVEGWFQVQGEASQLVVCLLDPEPGERILDACAAPGGKSTGIAEFIQDRGEIDAIDISSRGIERIKETRHRLGLTSIHVLQADVTQELSDRVRPPYDRVLVDSPCSGLGTLRAHPEIKWNRSESDIERLSLLQKKILTRVADYLKAGGIMVYSTCTLVDTENERVVEDFLEHHNGFVLDNAAGYLPEQARGMVRGKYFMALPHRHNTDGFFAARVRKVAQ